MIRDDLDYIEVELNWVQARLRRLVAYREQDERRSGTDKDHGFRRSERTGVWSRRVRAQRGAGLHGPVLRTPV